MTPNEQNPIVYVVGFQHPSPRYLSEISQLGSIGLQCDFTTDIGQAHIFMNVDDALEFIEVFNESQQIALSGQTPPEKLQLCMVKCQILNTIPQTDPSVLNN